MPLTNTPISINNTPTLTDNTGSCLYYITVQRRDKESVEKLFDSIYIKTPDTAIAVASKISRAVSKKDSRYPLICMVKESKQDTTPIMAGIYLP